MVPVTVHSFSSLLFTVSSYYYDPYFKAKEAEALRG